MDDRHGIALAELRKRYPTGASVVLVRMDDKGSPPVGTRGKVLHVDDLGTVHVLWETGSRLGIIPTVDEVRLVAEAGGCGNG